MQRLALSISKLSGWRRFAAAGLAGALSVLAFAPFHIWPVMLLTLPVVIWLLDGAYVAAGEGKRPGRAAYKSAALIGWAFGFGYFLAGLYWIGSAFLVEAEIFAWMLPFAVTLMPAGLAIYYALAAVAAGPLWRPGPARIVALAAAFTLVEWLRGHLLTGFPWNTLGYALTWPEPMMQWASVFGVYGLTLFTVLILAAPAAVWGPGAMQVSRPVLRFGYPAVMAMILALAAVWGYWRLQNASTGFVKDVQLRIVQPSIPQEEKWKLENRAAVFQRYIQVSREQTPGESLDKVSHLIWPESALPFLLEETPEALQIISDMLPDGAAFITGAARAERNSKEGQAAPSGLNVFNSVLVMNSDAEILGRYDKVHLVPFGEYLPFQEILERAGLEQLTRIRGGFTPGKGARTMGAPGVPDFIALVCYEIIFPDAVREKDTSPGWLLNLTNDAWFGDGTGPHQHFHQARVRAVEQGLPLVRAANNGITAVVDPYGRVVAGLPRNAVQALDSGLPEALPQPIFAKWGIRVFFSLLVCASLLWWITASLLHTD